MSYEVSKGVALLNGVESSSIVSSQIVKFDPGFATKQLLGGFAKQLKFDSSKAVIGEVTEFGTKYNLVLTIKSADGTKFIDVLTAWIKYPNGVTKLVTVIPPK